MRFKKEKKIRNRKILIVEGDKMKKGFNFIHLILKKTEASYFC